MNYGIADCPVDFVVMGYYVGYFGCFVDCLIADFLA